MIILLIIINYHSDSLIYKICIILFFRDMSVYKVQMMMYNDIKLLIYIIDLGDSYE